MDDSNHPLSGAEEAPARQMKPAEPVEISAQKSPTGTYVGKRGFLEGEAESTLPAPTFAVLGADVQKVSAGPALRFTLGVNEPTGQEIFTIALMVQIHIDPALRKYDAETREKLIELFGDPSRWAATTRSFVWTQVFVLVPSFIGATTFDVPVLSNFDLELAATKYFYSLPDGDIPLTFNFSGSIYYKGEDGRIQVIQVPWSSTAKFRLPIDRWKAMVDFFYPNTAWVSLKRQTLDRLLAFKSKEGLSTFDACITKLLGVEDFHQPNPFAFKPSKGIEAPSAPPSDSGTYVPGIEAPSAPPSDSGTRMPGFEAPAAPPSDGQLRESP
jgi:hypothetical protein